jgi:hypothetical protein
MRAESIEHTYALATRPLLGKVLQRFFSKNPSGLLVGLKSELRWYVVDLKTVSRRLDWLIFEFI